MLLLVGESYLLLQKFVQILSQELVHFIAINLLQKNFLSVWSRAAESMVCEQVGDGDKTGAKVESEGLEFFF